MSYYLANIHGVWGSQVNIPLKNSPSHIHMVLLRFIGLTMLQVRIPAINGLIYIY